MASINGLTVKKLKYFEGKEGAAAQGNLYLGNKKIAFWSQDANGCVEDNLDMEPGYSEQKLRQAIIAAHPEKHEEKIAQNAVTRCEAMRPFSNLHQKKSHSVVWN